MPTKQASFIKLTDAFGFNRYALSHWHVTDEGVTLYFANGKSENLTGLEAEHFRNWLAFNAKEAPETHQPTLWR